MEIAEWVTEKTIDETMKWVTQQSIRARRTNDHALPQAAMRAAHGRDPRLLLTLEKGAEVLQKMANRQLGAQGVDVGGRRVDSTEFQMWREAYKCADEGRPEPSLQWVYLAAAKLAGLVGM